MELNARFLSSILWIFVFSGASLLFAETNEQLEEKIKNSGKYLFEESYTVSEKQAKKEAYQALFDQIKVKKDKIESQDIDSAIQYLIFNNGLGVQVVAYLPVSVYMEAVKKSKRTNNQLREDIIRVPDTCSLKIASYSLENDKIRNEIDKNGTMLFSWINSNTKKMITIGTETRRVNFQGIKIRESAKKQINSLWLQHHFVCTKAVLAGPVTKTQNGNYEFNAIPLYLGYEEADNRLQQATIEFSGEGEIDTFFIAFKRIQKKDSLAATNNKEDKIDIASVKMDTIVKPTITISPVCNFNVAPYSITDENLRDVINRNTTKLFTEINSRYTELTKKSESAIMLNLAAIDMADSAKSAIQSLWDMSPFAVRKEKLSGPIVVRFSEGYEYRPVPLFVKNADQNHQYDEAVIVYDKKGKIVNFYYSIHKFRDIVGGNTSPAEYRKRQMILDFLENVRTAYNRKDIGLIKDMYSDKALIIKGFVVKQQNSDQKALHLNQDKIILKRVTKDDYIKNLKELFTRNSFVNIKFDDIVVTKHDVAKDIYGVQLKQKWNSSNYADTGFLFMMIDFRENEKSAAGEPEPPIIHVRVWQPLADSNGNELNIEQKYSLSDCGFIE